MYLTVIFVSLGRPLGSWCSRWSRGVNFLDLHESNKYSVCVCVWGGGGGGGGGRWMVVWATLTLT